MKYYKLITQRGYSHYVKNHIYSEIDKLKTSDKAVIDLVFNCPNDWIESSELDYCLQEGKMPKYFAIKRVEDDPLWQKYIDWLNKTYDGHCYGDIEAYYGFEGKVCSYLSLKGFKNNPVKLTLEQWDKIVNKTMEEEFKLPENWYIKVTDDNINTLKKWWDTVWYDTSHIIGMFKWSSDGRICKGYNPKHLVKSEKYDFGKEITTEQFIKYVMKEKDKEIIGYKCPIDLFGGSIKKGTIFKPTSSNPTPQPKVCPVDDDNKPICGFAYDLPIELVKGWEPIFAEEFKVGDWITIEESEKLQGGCRGCPQGTYQVISKPGNWSGLAEYDNGFFVKTPDLIWKISNIGVRLATPEEIKATQFPQITINDYKGEFFDWGVKFGCAEIDKEDFTELWACIDGFGTKSNKKITSVTIGKGTFTAAQIKEIAEFYLNKK